LILLWLLAWLGSDRVVLRLGFVKLSGMVLGFKKSSIVVKNSGKVSALRADRRSFDYASSR